MMRRKILRAALAVVLVVSVSAAVRAAEDRPRSIILIGWDGAQRNHVRECLERNELPNLKQLFSEGVMVDIDVKGVTDTKAGWSQILTGYDPAVTGVYSNARYQPIPKGYSVFERLEAFFAPGDFVTAAIVGKKGNVDNDPPLRIRIGDKDAAAAGDGKIIEEDGVRYRVTAGKPYFYTSQGVDVWMNALGEDRKVGDKTLELLEKSKDKPFFFFVHFAEVDQKGHAFGENSKEYNDALISADTQLGRIVAKLKELKIYDGTLIYVTADHGFDEDAKNHRNAPYVFLATNDPKVTRAGTRADITPTILDRLGLDLGKLDPPLAGRPLSAALKDSPATPAPMRRLAPVEGR